MAQKYENWDEMKWSKVSPKSADSVYFCFKPLIFIINQVAFSDETYVDIGVARTTRLRRYPNERVRMVHTQQHRPLFQRVMFWGGICSKGPIALSRIDGTMTGPKYIATLNRFLVPFMENRPLSMCYQFQHDNALSHTAQITKCLLADNSIEVLPNWPPYSSDLNVIENLWAFPKNRVQPESVTKSASDGDLVTGLF